MVRLAGLQQTSMTLTATSNEYHCSSVSVQCPPSTSVADHRPSWSFTYYQFQKTPTSDFESRLVQQIWIPFSLNFVETFFVYYRTPMQIFERFGSEWRLEQWVVGEIQNKITPSHGTSQRAESGEILRNVTISSRS